MNLSTYMKRMLFLFIPLLYSCATSAPQLPVESYPYSADTKQFGVRLFLIEDKAEFLKMWSKPQVPNIKFIRKIGTGKPFAAVVLYWGGLVDQKGNCRSSFKLKIMDENGIVYAESESKPLCISHPPPPTNQLSLGETVVDLAASGQPIKLIVFVEAIDEISGEKLKVSAPIEVIK